MHQHDNVIQDDKLFEALEIPGQMPHLLCGLLCPICKICHRETTEKSRVFK